MATLSVLSYNLSQGLQKMKAASNNNSTPTTANASDCGSSSGGISSSGSINLSKTFNKITVVQNVLSENNANSMNISNNSNVNTIVRKIKDFGMFGTVNNAAAATTTTTTASSCIKTSVTTPASTLTVTARKRPLIYEGKVKGVGDIKPVPVSKKPKLHHTKDAAPTQKLTKKLLDNINRQIGAMSATACTPTTKPLGTPGRKGLPLPQAVARRNARERNRVKQVNNGFAALRERIPEEVAETFEAQGNGRGSAKKLSKVETLRMAVEYIRSLERLLGFDFPIGSDRGFGASAGGFGAGTGTCSISAQSFSSGEDSFTIIKDEFDDLSPRRPADEEHYEDTLSHYDMDEYFNASSASVNNSIQYLAEQLESSHQFNPMDMLPNITTLNGQQYIRIPGTNTYQLLTADIFIGNSNSPPNSSSIDDEQFNALIDTNCLSPAATSSSVCTAADLHSSPPSINDTSAAATTLMTTTITSINAPALVAATTNTTETTTNGECVNIAAAAAISSLSRSPPVPQQLQRQQQLQQISSPIAVTVTSTLHHNNQQLQPQATTTLSPAANELLLQTCATATTSDRLNDDERQFVAPTPPLHQQQQPHLLHAARMIKQEFNESDFVPISHNSNSTSVINNHTINTTSPSATPPPATTLIYQQTPTQQQQQHNQLLLVHATMSPPLDRCHTSSTTIASMLPISTTATMSTAGLHAFYEHDQHNSFYEGVVSLKKELNDVLLDTSNNTTVLSDESMMEAIDWWEAHTPKSDGGSVML